MNTETHTETTTETPANGAEKKPDTKPVTIPVRHMLSDAEIRVLSERGVAVAKQIHSTQRDFDSLKASYKFKITTLETERENLDSQIGDGFVMRDTACELTFNDPQKGQKTTRRLDTNEIVCTEQMSPFDNERDLPLEEEQPKVEKPVTSVLPDDLSPGGIADMTSLNAANNPTLGTSIGDAIAKAAAATIQPQVIIAEFDSPDWGAKTLRNEFKKAAAKAGWPVAVTETLLAQCKGSDVRAIRATLAPHVKGAKVAPMEATAEANTIPTFDPLDGPIVDGQIHSSFGFLPVLAIKPITDQDDAEELKCRIGNASVVASWPELARQALNDQLRDLERDEIVELAKRLTGGAE